MNRFKSFISAAVFCIAPGVFGMPEQVANDNQGEIVERVRTILENVRFVERRMEDVNNNPVVLVGATGSGKTSLLHVLAGSEMMAANEPDLADRLAIVPDEVAARIIGRVAGGGESVTLDVHLFQVEDVVYCDGPGFFDTNGGFVEMGNNLMINEILRRGTKILWVVSVDEILAARGGAANRSLDYLESLLPRERTPRAERKARSVGIVVSKARGGEAQNGLNILMEQEGHHWLIDYLSERAATNAFFFPAPREEGIYVPPQNLVEGIMRFARAPSELISGSMGLRPEVIDEIIAGHESFDVMRKVDDISTRILSELRGHGDDFSRLRRLDEAFDMLWRLLAARSIPDDPQAQEELIGRWKNFDAYAYSDPLRRFDFTLRNFVDVLDGVEYFRNLCDVGDGGFASWFERGLLWEELVGYISRLSGTLEMHVTWLRNAGDSWKTVLPSLMEVSREVSRKNEKRRQIQVGNMVIGLSSAIGAGVGGIVCSSDGGSTAIVTGTVTGGVTGMTLGKALEEPVGEAVDKAIKVVGKVVGKGTSSTSKRN